MNYGYGARQDPAPKLIPADEPLSQLRLPPRLQSMADGDLGEVSAGRIYGKDGLFDLSLEDRLLTVIDEAQTTRVRLGRLGANTTDYGIEIFDAAGNTILAASGIPSSAITIGAATTFETGYNPTTKAVVIRATTAPTTRSDGSALVAGDLWIDTDDGDAPYTWNGTAFTRAYTRIDGGYIVTGTVAANRIAVGAGTTFDSGYDPTTKAALTSVGAVIRATTAPTTRADGTALRTGDVWLDTDDGDRPSSWNGTAWVATYTSILPGSISTTTLSAIVANLGEITAGWLGNAAPASATAAIRLSGTTAIPATNFIDFTATTTAPFLKHNALSLLADGTATFSGALSAATGSFSGTLNAGVTSVSALSALNADLGTVTAGYLRNSGNTAAIRLSGATALPSTNFIDFTATGNNPWLKTGDGSTTGLTLEADGDATFYGTVASTSFTGSVASFTGEITLTNKVSLRGSTAPAGYVGREWQLRDLDGYTRIYVTDRDNTSLSEFGGRFQVVVRSGSAAEVERIRAQAGIWGNTSYFYGQWDFDTTPTVNGVALGTEVNSVDTPTAANLVYVSEGNTAGAHGWSNSIALGGTLSVTGAATLSSTLAVTGAATFSGGAVIAGGTTAQGKLYKDAALGLVVRGVVGSTHDFYLVNAAGSDVMSVATGTTTAAFAGAVSISSTLSVTGTITQGGTAVALSTHLHGTTTAGDLIYNIDGTSLTRLALGANGTVLKSDGVAPFWGTVDTLPSPTTVNRFLQVVTGPTWAQSSWALPGSVGTDGQFLTGLAAGTSQFRVLAASDIPSLDASKITTGTFDKALIPTTLDSMTIGNSAAALSLKAGATADHVYIQFYADSAAQTTRSAYIGFGSAGSTVLNIVNELGSQVQFLDQIASTVATGTSPFSITSTTVNTNLNADLVDGIHGTQLARLDANNNFNSLNTQSRFYSDDILESSTGSLATLEVYQDTAGSDAFMAFHVSGDFAAYFGLKGDINDFAVGGWSMGATYHRVWHAGNDGASSGLDADLLDGLHGSAYATASHSHDASDIATGVLNVSKGGTGNSSPTSGTLLVGAGTSAMTLLSPSTAGGYVRSNGSAWVRNSGVPASDVTAGTFGAGNYTLPSNVVVGAGAHLTWHGSYDHARVGDGMVLFSGRSAFDYNAHFLQNSYYHSTQGYTRIATGTPTMFYMSSGLTVFRTAGSGNAGTAISWTDVVTIGGSTYRLDVTGSARVTGDYHDTSHRRWKDEIEDWPTDLEAFMALRPRMWVWNKEGLEGRRGFGFVSDEVADFFASPDRESIIYNRMLTQTVGVVQQNVDEITRLKARVAELEEALNG